MSWNRLDDGFHSHRKVARIGKRKPDRLAALGLWALCLSYTGNHPKEGGFVTRDVVARQAGDAELGERLAALLVEAKLWEVGDGGWQFHDWHDYRPRELSEVRAKAGRAGGNARASRAAAAATPPQVGAEPPQVAPREGQDPPKPSEPLEAGKQLLEAKPPPVPSRPDPDPIPSRSSETRMRGGGTSELISRDDVITPELRAAAEMQGVREVDTAWAKFTGLNDGRWVPSRSGHWQYFCVREKQIEERDRNRARGNGKRLDTQPGPRGERGWKPQLVRKLGGS